LFCNAQFSIEKGNVPASYSGFKGTLLLQSIKSGKENGNGYLAALNKIYEKRFNKFYKGEFELIDADEVEKGSYKSTKTYPFVLKLLFDHHAGNTYFYKFIMVDRANGKEYETEAYADNTLPTYSFINSYAKALEKLRGKE